MRLPSVLSSMFATAKERSWSWDSISTTNHSTKQATIKLAIPSASCTQNANNFSMEPSESELRTGRACEVSYLVIVLIAVLPCTLRKLLEIGSYVAEEKTTCKVCSNPATSSCAKCRGVKYCGKVFSAQRFGLITRSVRHLIGNSTSKIVTFSRS